MAIWVVGRNRAYKAERTFGVLSISFSAQKNKIAFLRFAEMTSASFPPPPPRQASTEAVRSALYSTTVCGPEAHSPSACAVKDQALHPLALHGWGRG